MSKYALQVTTPPSLEPLSVAEAKTHLRLEESEDTAYVESLIKVARQHLEELANRAFITQTLKLSLCGWPSSRIIRLPRAPAQSVVDVKYIDGAGMLQTISPSDYVLNAAAEPAEIWPNAGKSWPSIATHPQAVQITYTAGYGSAAADVPETVRHTMRFLVAHWYENREIMSAGSAIPLPMTIDNLVSLFRVYEF